MRIIKNRQTGSQLGLRIYPQQDLVRELIAGGCNGRPKRNIEYIPIGVIGDAGCSHRFSPPVPQDLVSAHDKIVLGAARSKAETNHGHDRTVTGGQIFKVSVDMSSSCKSLSNSSNCSGVFAMLWEIINGGSLRVKALWSSAKYDSRSAAEKDSDGSGERKRARRKKD